MTIGATGSLQSKPLFKFGSSYFTYGIRMILWSCSHAGQNTPGCKYLGHSVHCQRVAQISLRLKSKLSILAGKNPTSHVDSNLSSSFFLTYYTSQSWGMARCYWTSGAIPDAMASSRRAVPFQPAGADARRRLLLPAQAFWGTDRRPRLVRFQAPPRCHKMYVPGNSTFGPSS
jgi:hypothetical protein